jgi:hypothetical protein
MQVRILSMNCSPWSLNSVAVPGGFRRMTFFTLLVLKQLADSILILRMSCRLSAGKR